jgi:hypothetical protein
MYRISAVIFGFISCMLFVAAQDAAKDNVPTHPPNYVEGYIDVESIGIPPADQPVGSSAAYADARRAAYLLASRGLAERLVGMYMESSTSFGDSGKTEFADKLTARLQQVHAPGGEILKQSSYDAFQQENQVDMVVRFQLSSALPMLMNELAPHLVDVESSLPKAVQPGAIQNVQSTPYDGLVVKVPAGFEPSITPKIFNTEGALVYGSGSVAAEVLKMQGMDAQFTTTEGRAVASLEAHGAKHPLVVSGYLHTGNKDIDLDDADARRVMQENARGHFFERGRVFFVVGSSN